MGERLPLELPSHSFLAQLARDDPGAYEDLRRELIEDLVDSAPEEVKQRLRGLQFRIDGLRRLSPSPLSSTRKVFALMWESFVRLDQEMSCLRGVPRVVDQGHLRSARVLEFRPRAPQSHH